MCEDIWQEVVKFYNTPPCNQQSILQNRCRIHRRERKGTWKVENSNQPLRSSSAAVCHKDLNLTWYHDFVRDNTYVFKQSSVVTVPSSSSRRCVSAQYSSISLNISHLSFLGCLPFPFVSLLTDNCHRPCWLWSCLCRLEIVLSIYSNVSV